MSCHHISGGERVEKSGIVFVNDVSQIAVTEKLQEEARLKET